MDPSIPVFEDLAAEFGNPLSGWRDLPVPHINPDLALLPEGSALAQLDETFNASEPTQE